jgi:aldehyde dehydrogenase (NAD+)
MSDTAAPVAYARAARTPIDEFRNHIDGKWSASRSGKQFDDVNPADTSDIVGRFPASSAADAEAAVRAASAAFAGWKRTPVSTRARILNRAADYLETNVDRFAGELTREQGKALNLSKDEILRSAQTLRFYAVEGQSFTGETFPNDDPDMVVYTQREPLGVVSVITPWNFPVSIPARKIAPALIAGNTVVFKPSSDAPLSGYRLVEAFVAAGIPNGVLNFIVGSAADVGPAITVPPVIRAISFTGSTTAGEQIHRSVSFTTRTQMELGGKNPLIVMEDADLDKAVDLAIKGGFSLSGQGGGTRMNSTSRHTFRSLYIGIIGQKYFIKGHRITSRKKAVGFATKSATEHARQRAKGAPARRTARSHPD